MWSEEKSKIARRCGEKHIFKWKCTKHVRFGALFEVEMLKNCTPLWREAHFQVKMYKTLIYLHETAKDRRYTLWSTFPCNLQHFQGVVSQPLDTTRSALWKKHRYASKCCACHEKTYYTLRAVTKWRFWTRVKYCPAPYYTLRAVVKRKFFKNLSFDIQRIILMFNLWETVDTTRCPAEHFSW